MSATAAISDPCVAAALARCRPRLRLPIVDWAERHFRLTRGPLVTSGAQAVPWRRTLDPLSIAPLEAMVDPRWSSVLEMGSPQASGKTTRVLIRMLYALHQDRTNLMYFGPSKDLARDQFDDKFKPALKADPTIALIEPEDREEGGVHTSRKFIVDGVVCSAYFRGAEARGALSAVTTTLVVGDDVHAMPRFPDGDHPCDVASERTDAMPQSRRTHVFIGQAGLENDWLARRLFASTFYVPASPCPACGAYQLIEWDRMVYAEADPDAARELCALKCAACAALIGWGAGPDMIRKSVWVSVPPGENWITDPKPGGTTVDLETAAVYPNTHRATVDCGFWRSALYSPYVSWGDQAVKALAARGSPEAQLNFQRRVRCVPIKPPAESEVLMTPADIAAHAAEGCRWQVVPDAADILLMTADCQAGYVYYVVRAWRRDTGSSWMVECGSSKTEHRAAGLPGGLELLAQKDAAGWKYADGRVLRTRRNAVDSGYEPDLVWRHIVRYGTNRWFPTKGSPTARTIWQSVPNRVKNRLYWPVGVNEAKSVLWRMLQIPPGQPGYHTLPVDMPTQSLDAYTRHMLSEVWDNVRRLWVKAKAFKSGVRGGRNDYWDCEVLQIALAISLGVKLSAFDSPPAAQSTPERMTSQQRMYAGPERGPLGGRKPIRRNYR